MLSVFFGSDRKSAVDAALMEAKKVSSEPVTIDEYTFVPGQFEELITASSLFGEDSAYVIDTPSSNTDFLTDCTEALGDMAESQNHFYIIEGTLLAPAKKEFSKHTDKVEEFTANKPERFNVFGLSEALSRRDKKTLWLTASEASLLGIPEEEIVGILWWQLKVLRLAAVTNSAQEAGMKDYPYRKAKQALGKFSSDDINRLSHSLLSLYHDGHKGVRDMTLALEKWILKL